MNNQYIGNRYVPKQCGDWDNLKNTVYESLSVVLWQGASYTSKKEVPKGIDIENILFWVKSADYNAQVAIYEQNVRDYHQFVLDEILSINNGFDTFKTEETASFNAFKDAETASFNAFKADNAISPESFTGTDFEKIQQAFAQAILEKRAICISKIYDIGANTINLGKKIYSPRNVITIYGGGTIKKSIAGFIFSSDITASGDYIFNDIKFVGSDGVAVKVFDCSVLNAKPRLIRITTNKCFFHNLDTIYYSDVYIQTIKMIGDTIIGCSNQIYDVQGGINVINDGLLVEDCFGGFIKHGGVGDVRLLSNFVIINSCIESLTNPLIPAFYIKGTQGLTIKNNYFEKHMGGSIVFDPNVTTYNVDISNNFHSGTNDSPCLIKWGRDLYNCKSELNFSSVKPIHDTTQVLVGVVRSSNDFSASVEPNIETNAKFLWHIEDNLVKIEKGVFTPSVVGTTVSGVNTYSTRYGTYVKHGNLVTCDIALVMATKDEAMSGNVEISGLPFLAKNITGYYPSGIISSWCNITLTTEYTGLTTRGKLNTSNISLQQVGSGKYRLPLPVSALVFSSEIFIKLTYEI